MTTGRFSMAAAGGALALALAATPAAAFIRIDDFRDPQLLLLPSGVDFASDAAIAPKVLGGERDVAVSRVGSVPGDIVLDVADGRLVLDVGGAQAELTLVYDGVDDDDALDPSGLGDVDLTELGTEDRFSIRLRVDEATDLQLQIFDTGDPTAQTWSAANVLVPGGAGFVWVEVPFSALTQVGPNGAADVRDVGAILLHAFGPAGLQLALDDVRVPEAGTSAGAGAALLALLVLRRRARPTRGLSRP